MSREFWAAYVTVSGEIRRYGEGQAGASEPLPLAADEALWTSGDAPATKATHYIGSDGVAVAYDATQAAAKADRPAYRQAHWDNSTMAWVDDRTLDQLKASRWDVMLAARSADEFGPFVWDGSTFDGDDRSQARIQGTVLLALLAAQTDTSFAVDWTLADNTIRTLTGVEMIAVGQAMSVHVTNAHAAGRARRAAIEAATTAAAVESVTWD